MSFATAPNLKRCSNTILRNSVSTGRVFCNERPRECTSVHDQGREAAKARDVPRYEAKKWLRHLVLPSAFCFAEMLRLPFGVEPPSGFGSFFVGTKNAEMLPFPQIQLYRSIFFASNKIWAKKMAPAPGFEPGTKWLTATYSTAELCRSMN